LRAPYSLIATLAPFAKINRSVVSLISMVGTARCAVRAAMKSARPSADAAAQRPYQIETEHCHSLQRAG
jgi:hypothetical protein